MPDPLHIQHLAKANPNRGRRYTMRIVTLAKRMYADGNAWTPAQIRDYLARTENLPTLKLITVKKWVVPGYRDEQERWRSISHERVATAGHDQTMLRLRRLGLSYPTITVVMLEYHDVRISAEDARFRLVSLFSVEKNPNKARRAVNDQRRGSREAA